MRILVIFLLVFLTKNLEAQDWFFQYNGKIRPAFASNGTLTAAGKAAFVKAGIDPLNLGTLGSATLSGHNCGVAIEGGDIHISVASSATTETVYLTGIKIQVQEVYGKGPWVLKELTVKPDCSNFFLVDPLAAVTPPVVQPPVVQPPAPAPQPATFSCFYVTVQVTKNEEVFTDSLGVLHTANPGSAIVSVYGGAIPPANFTLVLKRNGLVYQNFRELSLNGLKEGTYSVDVIGSNNIALTCVPGTFVITRECVRGCNGQAQDPIRVGPAHVPGPTQYVQGPTQYVAGPTQVMYQQPAVMVGFNAGYQQHMYTIPSNNWPHSGHPHGCTCSMCCPSCGGGYQPQLIGGPGNFQQTPQQWGGQLQVPQGQTNQWGGQQPIPQNGTQYGGLLGGGN